MDRDEEELDYDPAAIARVRADREAARPRCACGQLIRSYGYDGRCEDCWVSTSGACKQASSRVVLTRDGALPTAWSKRRRDGGGVEALDGPASSRHVEMDLAVLVEVVIANRARAARPKPAKPPRNKLLDRNLHMRRYFPRVMARQRRMEAEGRNGEAK